MVKTIKILIIALALNSFFLSLALAIQSELKAFDELQGTHSPIKGAGVYVKPVFRYQSGDLRDPFMREKEAKPQETVKVPAIVDRRPLPPMNVQGLILGGLFPQAIIDNKIVKIGDKLGEVAIVKIEKSGITVKYYDNEYNLPAPINEASSEANKESRNMPKYSSEENRRISDFTTEEGNVIRPRF